MESKILDQLNDVQKQAVTHRDGPLMIIAGAGSGKTRVLTFRIAWLIRENVDPFNILALTFTNKASREMRNRIEKVVGLEARNIWMGTFHSIFARILRFEADKLGYPKNFTIYDSDDSKSLIKAIVKEEGLDPKLYKPGMVYGRISLAKNSFISVKKYQEDEDLMAEDIAQGRPQLGKLYELYTKRCFKAGAMDFDDLLLNTYKLLNNFPDVLNKYQHKFQYILVDEYQDTNYVQYLIIKKLAAANRNICVVGDDAQSIYAFRGANINNILNFEKDYPEMKVYKLEQNYRSTKMIVDAATEIIRNNKYQIEKTLWTDNPSGSKIKVFKSGTESEEGKLVAQSIFEEKMKNHLQNKDFAILYRTNAQSRSFEEALRKIGINYRIVGGLSFYQRKEIKDLLAYFRLALNPNDEEALKRVINYPARGIGKTTLEKIIVTANSLGTSIWDVVENIRDFDFDARIIRAVDRFATMIQTFRIEIETKNAYDAAMYIAKNSTILKVLHEDNSIEGKARYENIQELIAGVKEFTEKKDPTIPEDVPEDKSLSAFLQDVSLLTDADTSDDSEDKVTMMTIHGAKGLEFPVVYIVGLEENLFPSQLSLQSREELEEERRLFYVAVTRAEKMLFMSYAATRYRWGNLIYCEPSRFIEEMNPRFLEYDVAVAERQREFTPRIPVNIPKPKNFSPPAKPIRKADPDFKPDDTSSLREGMNVEHNRFGVGEVVNLEGGAGNKKATIRFNDYGTKQILLKFAKLKIVR